MRKLIELFNVKMQKRNWINVFAELCDRNLGVDMFTRKVNSSIYDVDDNGCHYNSLEAYDLFYYEIVKEILEKEIVKDMHSDLVSLTSSVYRASFQVKEAMNSKPLIECIKSKLGKKKRDFDGIDYLDSEQMIRFERTNTLLLLISFLENKGDKEDDSLVNLNTRLFFEVLHVYFNSKKDDQDRIDSLDRMFNKIINVRN
jgi:hypothetical protein